MNTLMSIPTSRIHRSNQNPRKNFNEEKLQDLAQSIRERGVIQPIIVRPRGEDYEIVCGERRMRASVIAGLSEIPAVIRDLDDTQVLEVQIIENLQREDVHPMEEAEGYAQLIKNPKYGSAEAIAGKVGKSKAYVYGRMKLMDLVPEVRTLFYQDKLIPSTALLIARLPGELQLSAAEEIADEREPMNFNQAREYIIDEYMLQLKKAPFDIKSASLIPGICACPDCPKRTGHHPDLFADITEDSDTCTDRVCFKAKTEAEKNNYLAEAKKNGIKVMSKKEAKEIFPYGSYSLARGFVALDARCYADPKGRTYETLLRKNLHSLPVKLAEDPDGKVRKIMHGSNVTKALIGVGHNFMKKLDEEKSKDREERGERKEATQFNRFLFDRALDAVLEEARGDKLMIWMRDFVKNYIQDSWRADEFVKRRDPGIKQEQVSDELERIIENFPEAELPLLLIEMEACADKGTLGYEMVYGGMINSLVNLYGIDLNEIEKKAKEEYEQKKPKRGRKSMKQKVDEAVKARREEHKA